MSYSRLHPRPYYLPCHVFLSLHTEKTVTSLDTEAGTRALGLLGEDTLRTDRDRESMSSNSTYSTIHSSLSLAFNNTSHVSSAQLTSAHMGILSAQSVPPAQQVANYTLFAYVSIVMKFSVRVNCLCCTAFTHLSFLASFQLTPCYLLARKRKLMHSR